MPHGTDEVAPCCADGKCDGCACTRSTQRQPLEMDAARAQVARAVCASIRTNIETVEAVPALDEVDAQNKANVLTASKELHDSILVMAKQFERPRILRPDRRVKLVRG